MDRVGYPSGLSICQHEVVGWAFLTIRWTGACSSRLDSKQTVVMKHSQPEQTALPISATNMIPQTSNHSDTTLWLTK